jgi:hypothetical protein
MVTTEIAFEHDRPPTHARSMALAAAKFILIGPKRLGAML